ncbi:MAG TPA: lamin tail domain-containing protein [Candidatus Fraserbacteria bacterium]|nr:lamin tail domain-containing protein [Candidatus Fraserbacteria bacterium]
MTRWLIIAFLMALASLSHWQVAPAQQGRAPAVVINEIAWAGTAASVSDEWIELYNNTAQDIDLTGWTLSWAKVSIHFEEGQEGSSTKTVNGSVIPAHGFYLLERTDDNTVSDIDADLVYTGLLSNKGVSLVLRDERDVIVDTTNNDGGAWTAGTAGKAEVPYASMERIDPRVGDTLGNWASNDGQTRNGLDAKGDPLNGTPKEENSVFGS